MDYSFVISKKHPFPLDRFLLHINLPTDIRASNRTRHIALSEGYVSEQAAEDMIKISKVSSNDQVADIFTKPLSQLAILCHSFTLGLSINVTPSTLLSILPATIIPISNPSIPSEPLVSSVSTPYIPFEPLVNSDNAITCLLCHTSFYNKNKPHAHT